MPAITHHKQNHLDIRDQIITVVLMISVFLLGLIFTDQLSRAMASMIYNGYQRQLLIGSEFDYNNDLTIETGIATSTFSGSASQVRATLFINEPNLLTYQVFTSTSTQAEALVDINTYGCAHQINPIQGGPSTISVNCISLGASDIIPPANAPVLVRYYYAHGPARFPVCGNGVVNIGEVCDEGSYNGQVGHCNTSCSGIIPITPPVTPVCGNGVREGSEVCDNGANNGRYGYCNRLCSGVVTATCPSNFAPDDVGSRCVSTFSTDGELGCMIKCTPTISSYPASQFACSKSSDNKYRCIGGSI